jgi:hypothetical protein
MGTPSQHDAQVPGPYPVGRGPVHPQMRSNAKASTNLAAQAHAARRAVLPCL